MEKHITVGIAGHVDHGKTSLVKALTGIDTDRLEEEKRRSLSIESGIAPFDLESGTRIALVDVPGHTDFQKNTIRGLSSVDMAIIVVAADDGIMPQTLEHIQILDLFNAAEGLVVLSKADLVDKEVLELAELEIRDILEDSFLEGKPVIPFSAPERQGLSEIRQKIEDLARKVPGKRTKAPFRLWIDQVKGFPGYGTVVSGTILSGKFRQGDPLHLLPSGMETRARSLEIHKKNIVEASAGQRVGINLHKVPLKAVKRGMVLAEPGTISPTYLLNVHLKVLTNAKKPLKDRQRVKLYLGTFLANTLVVIMEKENLDPGEEGLVQFRLKNPAPVLPGDPFIVCLLNVPAVIAGGTVLEIPRYKYRKARAHTLIPYLKALRENDLESFMAHLLESRGGRLAVVEDLAAKSGFSLERIKQDIDQRIRLGEVLSFESHGVLRKKHFVEIKEEVRETIERELEKDPLKQSLNPEEIRQLLRSSVDLLPLQRMLAELLNEGRLIKTKGGFCSKALEARLSEEQEAIIRFCLEYAEKTGLVPFSADTIWKLHEKKPDKKIIQRLLDYLHLQGRLIRLNNRRFMTPQAMEEIKSRVKAVIKRNGVFTIPDCKEAMGYGRTVGVPVLEYLDSIGFTRREGDTRTLR